MVSTLKCVQALRQCQRLKTNIHGKSIDIADVLSAEFIQRQNLENLYKSVLLADVQYALDNKVELELWNNVFKEPIDTFRLKIKEKKQNNEKSDIQAKLSLFLDVSTGFYFQLLQEFCDTYDLDLPYHGKASQLGILLKKKKPDASKPKINACLYVCQDCLVHLGDLARYRNDMQQAHTFYTLASKVLPGNGQPYNQLAILASAKSDNLLAVFYYYKSISVPNPFPAASSNLQKTLSQMCAKQNYNIFTKTSGVTMAEYFELFLNFTGSIYMMQDISKINALKDQLVQDLKEALLQLTQIQLIHLMSVAVFNIQRCKHRNYESDNLTEEDTSLWHVSLLFCVQFFQIMLEYTSEMVANQFSVTELKCLPAIKLFTDWIVCSGSNTLAQEAFQENLKLYHDVCKFANSLLTLQAKKEKSFLPLMEDWEMHGVNPFRKIHRRYDYRIQPVEVTVAQVWNIRVSRVFHFIDWLCQQEHVVSFLTKAEQNGKVEYICKQATMMSSPPFSTKHNTSSSILQKFNKHQEQPKQAIKVLQKPKNSNEQNDQSMQDNIFHPKSRSLFRTESEDIGNLPGVKGPVQSYSLFDTIWSRQNTPPRESDSLSVGSPSNLLMTSVGMSIESTRPSVDIYPSSFGGLQQQNSLEAAAAAARSLETPTFDISAQLAAGLSTSAPKQSSVVSSSEFQHMEERMHSFHLSNLSPSQQPAQHHHHQHQQHQQHSPVENGPSMRVSPGGGGVGMWFKSQQPTHHHHQHHPHLPGDIIMAAPQQLHHHHHHQRQQATVPQRTHFTSNTGGMPLPPFGSMVIETASSPMQQQNSFITKPPGPPGNQSYLPSQQQFVAQAAPSPSSNFGAIGQNIRHASQPPNVFMQQQHHHHNHQHQQQTLGGLVGSQGQHRSWNGPPPGIPDPMVESRSIWNSTFGIGQNEISPLEQLIKDQRRHQQPR